ncbi:hypothetical protein [Roseospira visakhapatnamensis]|uniref:Uncharacterized protein n=1 Tax=Roseospira visakhapatnamensis TaxID=390880 RepID=A0A7W6RB15_9PROT|nr:hypothetical protein [Roseospira visakhapatnamensis]MBB4265194.1 hypothetical protein [Roseospira visakhapatnamensis]
MLIALIEITVRDPVAAADVVLRATTAPYLHPSAPGPCHDVVLEGGVAVVTREIFADGAAFGVGGHDHGEIRLANIDGRLDWLWDHHRDGRPVRVLIGDDGAAYDTFRVAFTGVAARIDPGAEVVVRIHDAFTSTLDQPLSAAVYAGTGDLEGPEALTDQPLWVVAGRVPFVPADQVVAADEIWCVCDRGPVTLTEARVRGQVITPGTRRDTLAALQAGTPAAGTWDWFGGSETEPAYLRFGSATDGAVTVAVEGGATAAERTTAGVLAALAARAGITLAADDLADLDAAQPAPVGGAWRGDTPLGQAIGAIAGGAGCGVWQDAAGVWRARRVEAPADSALTLARGDLDRPLAVDEADILACEPLWTSREDGGIQPWTVTLRFARNHAPLDKNAIAGAALDDQERLTRPWLTATATDEAVRDAHPMSVPREADTAFQERADAEAEAARRQALFAERRRYALAVALTPELVDVLDLGVCVTVAWPGLGLAAGRVMRITRLRVDVLALTADLTVWG